MDKKELMRYEEIVENLLLFYGDIIRKEEKKYRTLFDNASDAIIIADLNGKFIDVNKKAEKLTGYSREELLDLVVGDLSPIEDVYINSKVFRDGFEAGHLTHIGAKILRKDKTLVPVDITASVIEYGGKRVMQGIFRDMRERERLEQQIIESRLMFRTLFDSMDDYISLHDNDGVLKMANKSLANSVNLPVREILGKKCEDIYRCGQKDENCAIGRSIKTMKQEFSEVAVDRSIFHVWVYPMINRNGELEGVIQHRKNVTEYKLMEKEIFQLQKIAELGNMAGGIAHEIRNPLNTISSALYLMKKAAGKSNIKADSYISQIENSLERASNIINNILDFARPSRAEIESINISLLIEQIFVLIGVDISVKNIRIIKKINDSIAAIEGNTNIIRQVFLNLITNSIQAIKENGELVIETAMIQDCGLSNGCGCECLSVKISDNGIGMDAETLKNIFKPFFTTKEGGTGLGLYLIKRGIEKHKGRINVRSEKGKGTTFIVELPVKQQNS